MGQEILQRKESPEYTFYLAILHNTIIPRLGDEKENQLAKANAYKLKWCRQEGANIKVCQENQTPVKDTPFEAFKQVVEGTNTKDIKEFKKRKWIAEV